PVFARRQVQNPLPPSLNEQWPLVCQVVTLHRVTASVGTLHVVGCICPALGQGDNVVDGWRLWVRGDSPPIDLLAAYLARPAVPLEDVPALVGLAPGTLLHRPAT